MEAVNDYPIEEKVWDCIQSEDVTIFLASRSAEEIDLKIGTQH